jgi:hypothetical protein
MEKTIDEENILISFFLEERTIGRMKGRIYFPLFGKKKKGKEIFFFGVLGGNAAVYFFFFIRCYFKFKIKVKIRNLIFLPFTSLFL